MRVGIEAMNIYCGAAYLDVRTLFEARGLDLSRFDNLMMERKSVALPCEDAISNGVNAAKPIIDALSDEERNSIELLVTSTESAVDFAKSLSTYMHDHLKLSKQCRLFEIKQACYGGTAALHMAVNTVAANLNPNAKALVIATDTARAVPRYTYAEPSQGVGAVAMLVGRNPAIFSVDLGAYGLHSYEVMDVCRPKPELETGDNDLSLLSYLDCLENSYMAYAQKINNVDFEATFDYLTFHMPFGGMVKGAHRKLMRQLKKYPADVIESDFNRRLLPSYQYCVQVGNIYSATTYLALCGLVDTVEITASKRIGIFSYGSGCSSEFYSGVINPNSKNVLNKMKIREYMNARYSLTVEEYDALLDLNEAWIFGMEEKKMDFSSFRSIFDSYFVGKNRLVLSEIKNYHREYIWV
jgi:polyketide biosynthesis 3-hydroxy-3-methylglutaryl-CoA synthase-like enzyme PksG